MISDLWGPIQKHIDKLNYGSMPAVHHYTSVKGALGILESGRIWFTERTHLNDPSEISHGIEIAREILCKQGRDGDATRLDGSVKGVFANFRFFSTSFSFKYDDLSQWRNYADDGKGVILSFKGSAFNAPKEHIDRFVKDDPTALVCPMSYKSEGLFTVISCIIQKWNGTDIRELCDHILMISSMFKNDCWESENEYRFFVHHKREKILKSGVYRTRERSGQVISYLDLPIQNWDSKEDFPIYRITLGPGGPDGLDAQLRDFIFSKGIPVGQVLRSDIPYRSIRRI